MKALVWCCAVLSTAGVVLAQSTTDSEVKAPIPVTDQTLQGSGDSDWISFRRTTNSWGFSPLRQINRENVHKLSLVWARPLTAGIQEGTPLIYKGVMYLPNPRDVIQAVDATTGVLVWEYRREVASPSDITNEPAINRNLAIHNGLIFDNGMDGYLYALDVQSGDVVWETLVLDDKTAPSLPSSGPIVADGKVISGRGCRPNRGPQACVITAHDAHSGEELWRTSTIEPEHGPSDSWGGYPHEKRSHVGTWYPPSYDPELKLVFIGTSVTWPAPKFIFGNKDKSYLYHNSTLALNVDTGEIAWHYQHLVDHWDMDHVFERILDEVAVVPDSTSVTWINPKVRPGERRKVVTGIAGKTGIVYTLDRETGEFLWATPTVTQNVVKEIETHTGAVEVNPNMVYSRVGDSSVVCPSSMGGKNWPAGAYNPDNKLMFYPLLNTCMRVTAFTSDPDVQESYGILREHVIAPGTDNLGAIYAISAETGQTVWKHEQRAGTTSLVATGSRLLFGGDSNGDFRAFDQESGQVLWQISLGSQVTGFPVTFAANGRQFIAVSTGSAPLTAQHLVLTPELRPGDINQLFVFALPVAVGL